MNRLALVSTVALLLAAPQAFAEEPAAPGAPHAAEAEHEGRLPLAEAERPLTLPRFILSPEVDFDVTHLNGVGSFANLSLGASFGITDDLTVRAQVLPLQLAAPGGSGFHYGQITENVGPSVGASFRFVRGFVEVAGSLDLGPVTVSGISGIFVTPGVPVRIHATKSLRIDTGGYLTIAHTNADGSAIAPPQSATTEGINIPVSVLYDITEPIHIGAATGFAIDDLSNAGDTARIPLGVFAGYAIGGKDGPILDLDPFFTFPALFTPGADSKTTSGYWVAGISVGGFLYL